MERKLKTTRPVKTVRTIEDIRSLEDQPYDGLVTAHNLFDLLVATAKDVGNSKAVTVLNSADPSDVGGSWTHRELLAEVTRSANMFKGLAGPNSQPVVAFLAPTLPYLPLLLLGAQVAGVASSINYLLNKETIFELLNAEGATILVIPAQSLDDMCWSKAAGAFEEVPTLQNIIVIGDKSELGSEYLNFVDAVQKHSSDMLEFDLTADRNTVCALFHTGGTTGRPKLVQLTHGNQIHAAFGFAQVFGYNENDVVINGFPFFHVGGTMTVGLSVLAAGGHIIVPSPYGLRSPAAIQNYWKIVDHFKVTVVGGVPTSIGSITNSWTNDFDTSSVRMAVTGGAVLPEEVGRRFEQTTGIQLFETYGMTETAAAIAFNPGYGEPVSGSVGFRAPFSETRIVKPTSFGMEMCKAEESGLVQVRGPQVFPGYLEVEHNEGTLDPEGWLTTGDVGYMSRDQRLFLTGREKDLIVRSGHNIDPAAIENVANRFENVEISAAVGMPDQYAGEVPALFVVEKSGAKIDLAALQKYLEINVHEGPARPRIIEIIEELPTTAVGKIFKPALRELAVKKKVEMELLELGGTDIEAKITVGVDHQLKTVVEVELRNGQPDLASALETALKPLPQTYRIKNSDPVKLSVDGHIAVLKLNRPENFNAVSQDLMRCLKKHLVVIADMTDLRAVIITGEGKAFCAGGDLLEFEEALQSDKQTLIDYLRYNQEVLQMVEDLPIPVIGAINGVAVAGGLELLLCCDILIAAEGAQVGDGHTKYGIVPAGGATVRLMEKLSPGHAAQLFYTAQLEPVETLQQWGLISEIVPGEKLMDKARDIAIQICKCSPEAIRHTKALIYPKNRNDDRRARMERELEHFFEHADGKDLAHGLAMFRSKQAILY
ncbi:AMP-binding protein [Sneathiella limimaris]|uniref:AMP-binding protein n=1 Tax=Sneathiella limimaris TaxID=1964213 RepID=UPI00146C3A51|nr:AMP-binding protein [Sneathiella limimaris]